MFSLWKGKFDEYSEEWLFRFSHVRAIEWCGMPLFISQPLVPIGLIFFPAWPFVLIVVTASWAWRAVRYRLIGVSFTQSSGGSNLFARYGTPSISALNLIRLADCVQWLVHLKWPIAIGAGIILFLQGRIAQALLASLWPIATMILIPFSGASGLVGVAQKAFLLAMGFVPTNGDPVYSRTDEFHRPASRSAF